MEKIIPTHRFLITKLSLDIISIFKSKIEISYPNLLSLSEEILFYDCVCELCILGFRA